MSVKTPATTWIQSGLDEFKTRGDLKSNRDAAKALGVSPTSLSDWLTGKRLPVRRKQRLAEEFFPGDEARQRLFVEALSTAGMVQVRRHKLPDDPLQTLVEHAQPLSLLYVSASPLTADVAESTRGFFDELLWRFCVYAHLRAEPRVVGQAEFFRGAAGGEGLPFHVKAPVLQTPKRQLSMAFMNTPLRLAPSAVMFRGDARPNGNARAWKAHEAAKARIRDALRVSPRNAAAAEAFRKKMRVIVIPNELGDEYVRALGFDSAQIETVQGENLLTDRLRLLTKEDRPVAIVTDELTCARLIKTAAPDPDLDLVFGPDDEPPSAPYLLGACTHRAWADFWGYLDFAFESYVDLGRAAVVEQMITLHDSLASDFRWTLQHLGLSKEEGTRGARVWASRVIGLNGRGPRTAKFLSSPAWDEVLRTVRKELKAKWESSEDRPTRRGERRRKRPPRETEKPRGARRRQAAKPRRR